LGKIQIRFEFAIEIFQQAFTAWEQAASIRRMMAAADDKPGQNMNSNLTKLLFACMQTR